MTRAAAVFVVAACVAAAFGLCACNVQLKFNAPDAAGGCAKDQDCPLKTLHCDPESAECVACARNSDCASASRPVCDVALHRCVQCGADQDCASGGTGWKCVATTRSCVRTCATGADCAPAGNRCDDGWCAQCDDDHACTGTRAVCDPATRQCASCIVDAQCTTAAAPRCDRTSGQCVGCLRGADCASGTCDPTTWTCTTPAL